MASKNLKQWIGEFKDVIAGYDHYVDFNKVYNQMEEHEEEPNLLNPLIGCNVEDIEDFVKYTRKIQRCSSVCQFFLAITKNPIPVYVQGDDGKGEKIEYGFIKPSLSID